MLKSFDRERALKTAGRLASLVARGEKIENLQSQKDILRKDYGIEIDCEIGIARYVER